MQSTWALLSLSIIIVGLFSTGKYIALAEATDNIPWTVETLSGPVQGTLTKSITNEDVYVFYGIPYAEPPVKDLRFKPPLAVKPWTETLQATTRSFPCYQFYSRLSLDQARKEGTVAWRPWSEDCLKLNIWVPKPKPDATPVIVLIHSGWFSVGSGMSQSSDGSTLAAHSKNIVISVNYRLGVFGFLNLGIPEFSGNAGLLDQQLALKWIHANIQNFGGDREVIILLGAGGAGSASVGYHMISSGSKDLFRTAAIVGGAVTCSWAFQNTNVSLQVSEKLVHDLSCSAENIEEELNCLRNAHPEDIIDAAVSDRKNVFLPTVDGTFIAEPPDEAMKAGRFALKPTLVWTDNHEGSVTLLKINPDILTNPDEGFDTSGFRKALKRIDSRMSETEISIIEDEYLVQCHLNDHQKIRDVAVRVYSDALWACCMNKFVNYIAQYGGKVTLTVDELRKKSNPSWLGGVHESTVEYILGFPLGKELTGYSEAQANVSKGFIDWINYHSKRSVVHVDKDLRLYNLETKPYVYWDEQGPNYHFGYREEQCKIWDHVIPELRKLENKCEPQN